MTVKQSRQDAEQRPETADDVQLDIEDFETDSEDTAKPVSDWQLAPPSAGMGKEIKIGVAILVLISGVFGYVIFKNSSGPQSEVAIEETGKEQQKEPPAKEEQEPQVAQSLADSIEQSTKNTEESQGLADLPPEQNEIDAEDLFGGNSEPPPAEEFAAQQTEPSEFDVDNEKQRQLYEQQFAQGGAVNAASNQKAEVLDEWNDNSATANTHPLDDPQDFSATNTTGDFDQASTGEFAGGQFSEESAADDLNSFDEPQNVNPYAGENLTAAEAIPEQPGEFDQQQEEPFADVSPAQNEYVGEPAVNEQFPEQQEFAPQDDNSTYQNEGAGTFAETNDEGQRSFAPDPPSDFEEESFSADSSETAAESLPPENVPEQDFHQPYQHDAATGGYVMEQSGQASSTTMVRSGQGHETVQPEAEAEGTYSETFDVRSRENGYRTVVSDQNQPAEGGYGETRAAEPFEFSDSADFETEQPLENTETLPPEPEAEEGIFGADDQEFETVTPQPTANITRTAPQVRRPASRTYVVERNDSFWSIARQSYGDPQFFRALAVHNAKTIPHPKAMRPGVVVLTPPPEELQKLYPELFDGIQQTAQHTVARTPEKGGEFSTGEEFPGRVGFGEDGTPAASAAAEPALSISPQGEPQHRVAYGETLGGIARQYLGRASRWEDIYRLNQDRLANPNRLKTGMILRLPPDARREQVVERPFEGR